MAMAAARSAASRTPARSAAARILQSRLLSTGVKLLGEEEKAPGNVYFKGGQTIRSEQVDMLEKAMEEYRRERASSSAFIDGTMRRYKEDHQRLMKELDMMGKACVFHQITCSLTIALMVINHLM